MFVLHERKPLPFNLRQLISRPKFCLFEKVKRERAVQSEVIEKKVAGAWDAV